MYNLDTFFASTYALYLKTQCYHWHVRGPNFASLHALFEEQYKDLAEAVDAVAERILMRDSYATVPSDFKRINDLSAFDQANPKHLAEDMLKDLMEDHRSLAEMARRCRDSAHMAGDLATVSLMDERICVHEKAYWFLTSSLEQPV